MPCASGAKREGGGGKGEKREREKKGMKPSLRRQCASTCVVIGQEKQVHFVPYSTHAALRSEVSHYVCISALDPF